MFNLASVRRQRSQEKEEIQSKNGENAEMPAAMETRVSNFTQPFTRMGNSLLAAEHGRTRLVCGLDFCTPLFYTGVLTRWVLLKVPRDANVNSGRELPHLAGRVPLKQHSAVCKGRCVLWSHSQSTLAFLTHSKLRSFHPRLSGTTVSHMTLREGMMGEFFLHRSPS